MIGTDTSHVPAFAEILRSHPEWKINLVAAFKGGSPDIPASANRVEGFARTAHEKFGVELVESIDALLAKIDVVLLLSVDGRSHLAQVTPVLKARKPVFIDKPMAASLEDVHRIVQLAKQTGTPFFSSSSTRFRPGVSRLRDSPGVGKMPLLRVWGERGTTDAAGTGNYEEILHAIAEFFHTGRAPFDLAETIEIFEFMTAADLSKARNGAAVPLAEVRNPTPSLKHG